MVEPTAATKPLSKSTQLGDAVLTRRQITIAVASLAKQIDTYYGEVVSAGVPLVLVPIMKGAFYFCADLSRDLLTPHTIEPVTYRSYNSVYREDGHFVGLDNDALASLDCVRGAYVVVVDTIIDSGATYEAVKAFLTGYQPASVELCALIARSTARPPRFVANTANDNSLLYGYGLPKETAGGSARHLSAIYLA